MANTYRPRASSYEEEDRYSSQQMHYSTQPRIHTGQPVGPPPNMAPLDPAYSTQVDPTYSSQDLHRFSQNADRFSNNRNGAVWSSSGGTTYSPATVATTATAASVGNGSPSTGNGSDGHLRGSQSALLAINKNIGGGIGGGRRKWPKGKDFLFSTWAFVIGAHSLWEFPILTLKYGGVVFIMVYLFMFLLLGAPMLLLEMTLGQYSGLTPTKLFRNLCPAFTGLGFAVILTLFFHSVADLGVITWSAQATYLLFGRLQEIPDNFFYTKVLDAGESDLGSLGFLHGQLAISLGITCVVVFIFIAASTQSLGKLSILLVPACYGLLMTLTIRACMAEGGPQGILALLTPDWSHISAPWVWLEAIRIVFISLQLGLGVVSTLASYNKYHHNIIRDAGIISIGHFVWTILSVLFVFALLGVADAQKRINLDNLKDPDGALLFVSITGRGFWLIGDTLAESALAAFEYNWLWSGLLFSLVVLSCLATVSGAFETISACVVDEYPRLRQYKPAIAFTALVVAFLVNLALATQGGVHVYYMLTAYLTSWPAVLFGLLTVVAAAYGHGGKYLMKDMGDMSKMPLTHYVAAHLSVLYSSVIPVFLACGLSWTLYKVSQEHLEKPLVNFSVDLPEDWGMPLGWSLAFVPVLLIIFGFIFHLLWKSRGMPFKMHLKRCFKPTDVWYENEHRELMALDASSAKDSPILAYKRGEGDPFDKNITEV